MFRVVSATRGRGWGWLSLLITYGCRCPNISCAGEQQVTTYACSGCAQKARYCSKACQREAWPTHKEVHKEKFIYIPSLGIKLPSWRALGDVAAAFHCLKMLGPLI